MKGRKENEEKKIKKIEEMISDKPVYIKKYYYTLKDKSYTTQEVYIRYVIDFVNFASKKFNIDIYDVSSFDKIKKSDIDFYISSLEDKGVSIKRCRLYGIKSFFNFLIDDEYIKNNPCIKVIAPKDNEEHKITSLTKKEINIVKRNIFNGYGTKRAKNIQKKWIKRDYAIIMLGLSLGLRVTSLSEINLEDINFENKEIKIVEKGNKIRVVMFSENIGEILLEWIRDRENILNDKNVECEALFISNQCRRITSRGIEKLVSKYTQNIDKHITPHKLRSTCATNVYNKTGDIYLTADILGHSNIENTRRYAQISEERKKKAAQAMDDILF